MLLACQWRTIALLHILITDCSSVCLKSSSDNLQMKLFKMCPRTAKSNFLTLIPEYYINWLKILFRKRLPFSGDPDGIEFACSAGDLDLIPGLERSPGEREMTTHSSILAWRIPWTERRGGLHTVHGAAKSWTWLSDFHFTF